MKLHELQLPVYKQGDDMAACLEKNENTVDALKDLGSVYTQAAQRCINLANKIETNHPEIKVYGDTHVIWVEGPEVDLEALVQANLVEVYELNDENEDNDDEDEDDDEDEE